MAVLLWTVLPLLLLHLVLAWRWRSMLACQLLLDVVLAAVLGPALAAGHDLNPVRCLSRNEPFTEWSWHVDTELDPTQSDLVLQFHPWWEAARRQLLEGRLPLISPRIGAGLPLLANGQIGLLAPVMAPVWVLGPERGTTVMAFWKIELAGVGGFVLLASGLGLRWPAAALGAVVCAASCYQVAWLLVPLGWVTAAVPWLWWLLLRVMRGALAVRRILLVGVLFGWLLGCGLHPETASIAVGSALLGHLVSRPRRWRRLLAVLLVATPVAVASAWPTLVYMSASARVEQAQSARPNTHPFPLEIRLLGARQALLPTINGQPGRGDWQAPYPLSAGATGVGSVALALLAVGAIGRRRRPWALAAIANLSVVAVLVYRVPPVDWLLVRLPPFDHMALPRFQVLAPFALAVLAALALEGVIAGRLRRRILWWLPAIVLAVVAALALPWRLTTENAVLVMAAVVVAGLIPLLRRWPVVVPVVAAVELAVLAVGVNPTAAAGDRRPRPPLVERLVALAPTQEERIIGLHGMLPPNLASRYGIADVRAYDPLRPVPWTKLMARLGELDPILGGSLQRAPARLCGLYSIRYLVAPEDSELEGWERIWSGASASLWRNPEWRPEVRVVGTTAVVDGEAGWAFLETADVDLDQVAVVPPPTLPVESFGGRVEVLDAGADRITARVRADGATFLVVARPWAPGWEAEVDGEPAPVVRANMAVLGVRVPGGDHRVELRYRVW